MGCLEAMWAAWEVMKLELVLHVLNLTGHLFPQWLLPPLILSQGDKFPKGFHGMETKMAVSGAMYF